MVRLMRILSQMYCFMQVVKATKKDTGITYALKIMDKLHIVKENKTAYVKLERIVLDQLDHPGIVRLFFTFQDVHYLCILSLCLWLIILINVNVTCIYSRCLERKSPLQPKSTSYSFVGFGQQLWNLTSCSESSLRWKMPSKLSYSNK